MPKGPKPPTQHDAVIRLFVQLLGVGTFTLIAGISNNVGKLTVVFMSGLLIVWALVHVGTLQNMVSKI